VVRLGGANYGPHPTQPPLAREATGELVDELRQALVQRRLGRRQVLEVRRAGIAGADEGKYPRSRLGCGSDQRLQRVPSQQGIGGEGVGAKAADGAPGSRRLADQRLRVSRGGDGNVAALAVRDDQQARFPGDAADLFERVPAGGSQPLEAGELRLDGDAGGAGPLDQGPAMPGDRGSRQLCRRRLGVACRLPLPGQLGRVGVEAETDLTAALLNERRQPIGKASQRISRP
jgi:hypothetical protein